MKTVGNAGQKARNGLASAANNASDAHENALYCSAQVAMDVIEQRDELLKALEALLSECDDMAKRVGWAGRGARIRAIAAIAKATGQ